MAATLLPPPEGAGRPPLDSPIATVPPVEPGRGLGSPPEEAGRPPLDSPIPQCRR